MSDLAPVMELTGTPESIRDLLRGVWRSRTILPVLARQSFRGRYRAAGLGLLWTVVQPLARGAVLAIVFTQVVPIETDVPYVAFVLMGTTTWAWMQESIITGTQSIVTTSSLATRVYFPRLMLPTMPVAVGLPAFSVTLVLVLAISIAVGSPPGWRIVFLPAAVLLAGVFAASVSTVTSLLHVYFRDTGHAIINVLMVAFYATPVIYPQELPGGAFSTVLQLNPFTGPIALVRWSVIGTEEPLAAPLIWTAVATVIAATTGLIAYRRLDRICVDRL